MANITILIQPPLHKRIAYIRVPFYTCPNQILNFVMEIHLHIILFTMYSICMFIHVNRTCHDVLAIECLHNVLYTLLYRYRAIHRARLLPLLSIGTLIAHLFKFLFPELSSIFVKTTISDTSIFAYTCVIATNYFFCQMIKYDSNGNHNDCDDASKSKVHQ